jgi:hypothetical protein
MSSTGTPGVPAAAPKLSPSPPEPIAQIYRHGEWEFGWQSGPISSSAAIDAAESSLCMKAPEMAFFSNFLRIRHGPTGITFAFDAKHALAECKAAYRADLDPALAGTAPVPGVAAGPPPPKTLDSFYTSPSAPLPSPPPVQVRAAAIWARRSAGSGSGSSSGDAPSSSSSLLTGATAGGDSSAPVPLAARDRRFAFDWTYSTPYAGHVHRWRPLLPPQQQTDGHRHVHGHGHDHSPGHDDGHGCAHGHDSNSGSGCSHTHVHKGKPEQQSEPEAAAAADAAAGSAVSQAAMHKAALELVARLEGKPPAEAKPHAEPEVAPAEAPAADAAAADADIADGAASPAAATAAAAALAAAAARIADATPPPAWTAASADGGIPYDHLRRREPIVFAAALPLYEDELHDNGATRLSLKVRVMPSCFFLLLRCFVRVDDVLVRARETRLFHFFGSDTVIREARHSEATFAELEAAGHPRACAEYMDEDAAAARLPVRAQVTHILSLQETPAVAAAVDAAAAAAALAVAGALSAAPAAAAPARNE